MSSVYQVYVGGFLLPITPDKIMVHIANKNRVMELVDGSEVNVMNAPGLSEISFEVLLPRVSYPFAFSTISTEEFLTLFERLKVEKKTTSIYIIRDKALQSARNSGFSKLTLEEYSIEEAAENGRDLKVSLEFKKYVPPKYIRLAPAKGISKGGTMPVVAVKRGKEETVGDVLKKVAPLYHMVQKGDTLIRLAQKYYGDGKKYTVIAKLNHLKYPYTIYDGKRIRIL